MISSSFIKFAASSLVIGTSLSAWGPSAQSAQRSEAAEQAAVALKAQRFANEATDMLGSVRNKAARAYVKAEKAVALSPTNASYRVLLGRTYVAAGRFASAEAAFSDAMTLVPGDGRVALNLALMKIARGDNNAAMELLEAHRQLLSLADFGLAQALAGDLVGAVETLQAAARSPGADAKARQNLGLAYALAGRWIEARVVASQDLSPDLVDVRMGEWAQLASPRAAWDQVAGLLRVTPVADSGLPAQLALANSGPVLAKASPAAVPAAATVAAPVTASAPASEPEAETYSSSPAFETPVSYKPSEPARSLSIALEEPVPASKPEAVSRPASAKSAPLIRADISPLKQAIVPVSAPAKAAFVPAVSRGIRGGQYVVQLGAYTNLSRAEMAWEKASNRVGELRNYDPTSARVKVRGNALHRLSVAGFVTREAASQVCTQVRKAGGQCFVRSVSGLDAPMQFVSRGGSSRIAARR